MLSHPFRALGTLFGLLFVGLIGWAVTLGGYRLAEDPELEYERSWVQGFRQDQPQLAREIGLKCKHEIGRSGWTRDGAMALFRCIRAKGEERGHYYE